MIEEKKEGEGIDTAFCHPERMQILLALKKKPTYVSALSRSLGIERSLLLYHLQILKKGGYLQDRFWISDKGRSLHEFSVSEKADRRISILAGLLQNV